jgi:hypothetical protein
MGEYDTVLTIALPALIGVISIVSFHLWSKRNRGDKVVENRQTLQKEVEEVARTKAKEEEITRRELESSAKVLATDVKQDMKDHIDRLIHVLKQDIELGRTQTYAKIDTIDYRLAQLKIDLMDHIINEKDERVRMQKSIEMIQTMSWGPDAKSIPHYMLGEEETQEHKEEPGKGVFRDRPVGGGEEEKQTKENVERMKKDKNSTK